MESLREELLERYKNTGKIGFTKPKSDEEAYALIETVISLYQKEENSKIHEQVEELNNVNEEQIEEVVINLYELTEKLRNFFEKF